MVTIRGGQTRRKKVACCVNTYDVVLYVAQDLVLAPPTHSLSGRLSEANVVKPASKVWLIFPAKDHASKGAWLILGSQMAWMIVQVLILQGLDKFSTCSPVSIIVRLIMSDFPRRFPFRAFSLRVYRHHC